MAGITVLITQAAGKQSFEAVAVGLSLPVVTGRTVAEVKDNLLTALQRHIAWTCEVGTPERADGRVADAGEIARRCAWVQQGRGTVIEIPEYLLS
ncbi:MAG TPA: hypothetical protein GXX28_10095 [Firmicutes bacterium]|nr:hypothetical protein [Bacillota bacterium]